MRLDEALSTSPAGHASRLDPDLTLHFVFRTPTGHPAWLRLGKGEVLPKDPNDAGRKIYNTVSELMHAMTADGVDPFNGWVIE